MQLRGEEMGRPKKNAADRRVQYTLTLSLAQRERFFALADSLGVSRPLLGREAFRILLEELTPQEVGSLLGVNVG